jgi:N-acetylglucosamine-6-phosphate deacetylase
VNFTEELKDAITKRAVFLVLGVLGLQVLFIISYVGALHSPTLSRVPFDLVAPAPVAGKLSGSLNGLPGQPLSVSVTGTAGQAHSAVLNRDVYGALIVNPDPAVTRDTLLVASGGGAVLSNVLKELIGAAEGRQHRTLTVTDLAPAPQTKDFDGLSSFYLVVGWCVGGYLCASLLTISAGAKPENRRRAVIRTGAMALYAVAGGILGAVIVGPVLGALPGSFWGMAGLGALVVFSVGMLTLALQALTGIIGIGLAVLVVVIAGNPSAGGAFPWPMLPPFWRAIGPWLPPGAGTWTARSIAYFNGNAVRTSLLVLSGYAVAGAAVTLLVTLRTPGRHAAGAGADQGAMKASLQAAAARRARHAASSESAAARDEAAAAPDEAGAAADESVAAADEAGAAADEGTAGPGETGAARGEAGEARRLGCRTCDDGSRGDERGGFAVTGAAAARVIVHGARKCDVDGEAADFWLVFDGDRITAAGTGAGWAAHAAPGAEVTDAAGALLTPGFIDLHGHGGGGASFDDGITVDDDGAVDTTTGTGRALAVHRAHGTTRSVLSLVANPAGALEASLAAIADLAERDPLVLGAHLEGPFLAPSRKGAHNPDFLTAPSPAVLRRLVAAARGTLRQVTLAPELPGALDAIGVLAAAGAVVAVGHTEADEALAQAAFDRGARLLTHAFNAMPGIGHREPGPVVAAIRDERVTAELILDGVHVHPDVARLLLDAAPGRVALITDAMAAAGAADGTYRLGSLDVAVRAGVARLLQPDGSAGSIAGSTLTLDHALRAATRQAGMSLPAAVAALTWVPARVLGLHDWLGRLSPGYAADAVLLSDECQVRAVWGAGRRLA